MIAMKVERVNLPVIDVDDIADSFYTVLSVELGNTTIKSFITTIDLKTNKVYKVTKIVKLTRNIREPYAGEEVFGHTIWDKPLSREAVEECVRKSIHEALDKSNLRVDDIDFVVRSTGVVALSKLSGEVGLIIKALSNACLSAGIMPSQMTPPFSINNIPEHVRRYSFFNNIQFDGSVVSVSSNENTGVVANEMEGQLVTAGIKLAAKSSTIDYRNPVVSIDMGTTLAGQVIDSAKCYANLRCNYVGMAGGISDIMLRSAGIIMGEESTIDVEGYENDAQLDYGLLEETSIKLHENVDIIRVPDNITSFGGVAIDTSTRKQEITIIGSQIKNKDKLTKTFNHITNNKTTSQTMQIIDSFNAYLIKRLIDQTQKQGLLPPQTTLGITGRAALTGNKQQLLKRYLEDKIEEVILVQDALSLGAVMMARCMNSLGTPLNPIGGTKGGICIMQERIRKNMKKIV